MSPFARSAWLLVGLLLAGCQKPPARDDDHDEAVPAQPRRLERGSWRQPDIPLAQSPTALKSLKSMCGKDLRKLDNKTELDQALAILLPDCRNDPFIGGLVPWFVWEFDKKESRYLLFEVFAPTIHPGASEICLTLFGDTGKVLFDQFITTGWRKYLEDAELEYSAETGTTLLKLADGWGGGERVNKHYYGFMGDRFDLVRLEGRDGKARRNSYYVNHFRCGPSLPEQSVKDWEADLLSGDTLRALRVLVWLGGVHQSAETRDPKSVQHESLAGIARFENVRARPKVMARLNKLASSDSRWLSEAAQLARVPKIER